MFLEQVTEEVPHAAEISLVLFIQLRYNTARGKWEFCKEV